MVCRLLRAVLAGRESLVRVGGCTGTPIGADRERGVIRWRSAGEMVVLWRCTVARLHLAPGVRYLLKGTVYVVREVLLDNRLLVESQTFGGGCIVTREELRTAWARGELWFEVFGPNARSAPDTPLATKHAITDLGCLPEEQRDEARRRYRLILPLLAIPPAERSRREIEAYAASLQPLGGGKGASRTSLERWLSAFVRSGRDLRSLVPATDRRGGKGRVRLDPDVDRIVGQVLATCAANPAYRTTDYVYLMVLNRVADENLHRAPDERLKPPGRNTVHRRIVAAGSGSILRRRRSRAEKRNEADVSRGPQLSHVLERVEIDHTLLDLFVVDEDDRLPVGRPTLTLAIDTYSRMPFGLFVSFEPPSYFAVMGCLLHGILPKPDARELYRTDNPWPVWGLPETLVCDNGREFVGRDLEDACGQLGIILDPNPPRSPWYKGAVERFFRTHNTGLVHTLPGTTYSNLAGRGDYDPARHACVSLSALNRLLHIWLLDVYARDWHEGVKAVPAKLWEESIAAGWEPALHHSADEVRILLHRIAERTLGRTGIDFESLRYQSPELARLRSQLPPGARVRVRYDPGDLGGLHIYDPTGGGRWLQVPALDQEYASGLSLWKHRTLRRMVLAEKGEVDIYALAEAKERVREIAREEMKSTRRVRGRKRAARVLGSGNAATVPAAPSYTRDRNVRVSQPAVPTPGPAESAASDGEGWGGDYGLPGRGGR